MPIAKFKRADFVVVQELFSKLRFSYLEQVTKEKFLRAIVGDPPVVVGHNENVELETQLAEVKAELKASKEEARAMIAEMEKMGRDLASRECHCHGFRPGTPSLT